MLYETLGEAGFILDLSNFLLCCLVVVFFSYKYKLDNYLAVGLLASCAMPFFLNDVLFPATYMPDQFRYFESVQAVRALNFAEVDPSTSIFSASYIFSAIPLPFVATIKSLGFFNKLIYVCLFFFLYSRKILTKETALFLILYPSLALYTGLSLRDPLILLCMAMSFYFALRGNFLYSLCWLLPLIYLKPQNFAIQAFFVSIYFIFAIRKNGIVLKNLLYILVFGVAALFALAPLVLPIINKYRAAMWEENGGDVAEISVLSGIPDLIFTGIKDGFYFFLKPFLWESQNLLQIIQSIENVFVAVFVFWITYKCYSYDQKRTFFWIFFLIFSCVIYGLVVANFGTASRYRFPFFVVYVVFATYDVLYGPMAKTPTSTERDRQKSQYLTQ